MKSTTEYERTMMMMAMTAASTDDVADNDESIYITCSWCSAYVRINA